ncbi:MAG: cysteine desulfurase family protein [Gammaproteobacteria bacterium]
MTVYLDHNATTPLDERVLDSMMPYMTRYFGNPSSLHRNGRTAKTAVELAREQVAALVNAHPSQVVFTSGGTESNNLAIKGACSPNSVGNIAISSIEHPSVTRPAIALQALGWNLSNIPVDSSGLVCANSLTRFMQSGLHMVSIMMANNETGVVQDISAIGAELRENGVLFHTDAVQAVGKMPVDFNALNVHFLSLSAHKIYGPKGTGALVLDKNISVNPIIHGGSQENGYRAGTESVASIVGFGKAAELAVSELHSRNEKITQLRQRLVTGLQTIEGVRFVTGNTGGLANTLMVVVNEIDGETLLMQLDRDNIAVSSGSACSSESPETSHVLRAMGISDSEARSAIRISLGKDNTGEDIDALVASIHRQKAMFSDLKMVAY